MWVGGGLMVLGWMCPSFSQAKPLYSKEGMIYPMNERKGESIFSRVQKWWWKQHEKGSNLTVEETSVKVKSYIFLSNPNSQAK